ncbi:MAG: T9SS type A sorting domain-containing protein [Bacteroidetes bacterium]|nr:T9SS type A sorting domain-containing protein [Bacteroidota bacterium]
MNYKKIVILLAVVCLPLFFGHFTYKKSAGAHPGSTGAPGDNTCAKSGCHVGSPVTYNDTTVNTFIFSQADSTYLPGQTYTITIRTQNFGIQRFGFECQAIVDATSLEAGTVVVTDVIRTHEVTHMVGADFRTSVTHNTVSTPELSPGFNEWTFDWTAPSGDVGDIVFYYATNSTNNNNTATGDRIFNNTFRIRLSPLFSINEIVDVANTNAFYNGETNQIVLNYFLKKDKKVSVSVFDSFGREVFKLNNKSKNAGQQKDELSLKNKLSSGIYYINLSIDQKSFTKKISIQ